MQSPPETHQQLEHRRLTERITGPIGDALILLLRFYRYFLSPLMGHHCRFHPTCSCYAIESIKLHGPARGSLLSMQRLLKCHPWHEGGVDPVPRARANPHT